jgi:hypothetical protein
MTISRKRRLNSPEYCAFVVNMPEAHEFPLRLDWKSKDNAKMERAVNSGSMEQPHPPPPDQPAAIGPCRPKTRF